MGLFSSGKSGGKSERSIDSNVGKAKDPAHPGDSKAINVKTGTDKSFSFAVFSPSSRGESSRGFKVLEARDSKGNKFDFLKGKYIGGPKKE